MKRSFIALLMIFISFFNLRSVAQSLDWQWARRAGGNDECYGNSVKTDSKGNIYVAGAFESSDIDFGSIVLQNTSSYLIEDAFLAKYNANGNLLWVKKSSGNNAEIFRAMSIDNSDNIYITGNFNSDTARFDNFYLVDTNNMDNIFTVKYDTNGNVIWAKSFPGNKSKMAIDIANDRNGNILIVGQFWDTLTIGSSVLIGVPSINCNCETIFIAKFDTNGNPLWAKQATVDSALQLAFATGIASDQNNNVFVTGYYSMDTLKFGQVKIVKTISPHVYLEDAFLVKFDSLGNAIWGKPAGGTDNDYGYGITIDKNNNIIITGSFASPIAYFGSHSLINKSTLTYPYSPDNIFIAKYDPNGNVVWAKEAGGKGYSCAKSICTFDNNCFISGDFMKDTAFFDNHYIVDHDSLYSQLFIAGYDSTGNNIWVLQTHGNKGNIVPNSVCAYSKNNLSITGYFRGNDTVYFNNVILADVDITHQQDFFLANISNKTNGIADNNPGIQFMNVFPNPFSSQTTIQTNFNLKDATLTLYNSFGQQVKQVKGIIGQSISLNRDNLPVGLYFIRLTQENRILATEKVVIGDCK